MTDHATLPDTPLPTDHTSQVPTRGCPVAHGPGSVHDIVDRSDNGYFGPDSVSWKVFADPASKLGGVAAILLQSLNPMMMRLFAETSDYLADVEGRGERTGRYLDTIVYGDRAHAEAAAESVNRLHAASTWTDPRTGQILRADNEEWLAWTHNTLVYGLLRAADAFGPGLSGADQDRFVVEQHVAACLVEIEDESYLPSTRAELDAYIETNKDWMALTLPAAELSRSLRKPSLSGNPVATWVTVNVQDGILSLLPDWALLLFGIEGRPMNLSAAAKTTRKIVDSARQNASAADMIAEVTSRVETHPYRKVRGADGVK
ncbi:oxygenase MpaB family protein [Leucobacter aridicollis]|uniref:oxygenase MpaB family protein n=1 Tax=Leucobacter aridicollis TaxID=283878 RepID=UPI002106211E|nr:oxygenase MpaB family protein [Leucobacter aridicollis]